jgi:hypothetical protein
MANVGVGQKVNSRAYTLHVRPSATDLEYIQLQDKNFEPNHPVIVEPTTSGGVTGYTGALTDGRISGTCLFTDDMLTTVGGYSELAQVNASSKNRPVKTWKLIFTDFAGGTETVTCTGMLERFSLHGPAEGATKYDIVIRILTFDPSTDIT